MIPRTIFHTGRVQTESYTLFYAIKSFHKKFLFVLLSMYNGTNSMIINLLEKLTVAHLLRNYDRIKSSIAVFTKTQPALTQISSFHIITLCCSDILPNNTGPSNLRFPSGIPFKILHLFIISSMHTVML